MFTGLIEAIGKIEKISSKGGGITLSIDISGLPENPKVGASIAINGVCLTVTGISGKIADFDAVTETVNRTTLKNLKENMTVNLESALKCGDPLDGHIVQGHVDCVSKLLEIKDLPESKIYFFSLSSGISALVAKKGSIAVNGISLTVVDVLNDRFSVSLIPETIKRTNLKGMSIGTEVNLEADVIARYLARQLESRADIVQKSSLTFEKLAENGFL